MLHSSFTSQHILIVRPNNAARYKNTEISGFILIYKTANLLPCEVVVSLTGSHCRNSSHEAVESLRLQFLFNAILMTWSRALAVTPQWPGVLFQTSEGYLYSVLASLISSRMMACLKAENKLCLICSVRSCWQPPFTPTSASLSYISTEIYRQ